MGQITNPKKLVFLEYVPTRWTSFVRTLERIVQIWEALGDYFVAFIKKEEEGFKKQATKDKKVPLARELLKQLQDKSWQGFIFYAYRAMTRIKDMIEAYEQENCDSSLLGSNPQLLIVQLMRIICRSDLSYKPFSYWKTLMPKKGQQLDEQYLLEPKDLNERLQDIFPTEVQLTITVE